MKIISIEGLDKSGKSTAQATLKAHYNAAGYIVATHSLPDYKTPIGRLIRRWLTGDYMAAPEVFELLQAADKQAAQTVIETHAACGADILIIDRYLHSMWAYGAYDNDVDWLQSLTRHMRAPDAVVYMDVEPEVSMHRRGKYGDNDKYESDTERLAATRATYYDLLDKGSVPVMHVDANKPEPLVRSTLQVNADGLLEMAEAE